MIRGTRTIDCEIQGSFTIGSMPSDDRLWPGYAQKSLKMCKIGLKIIKNAAERHLRGHTNWLDRSNLVAFYFSLLKVRPVVWSANSIKILISLQNFAIVSECHNNSNSNKIVGADAVRRNDGFAMPIAVPNVCPITHAHFALPASCAGPSIVLLLCCCSCCRKSGCSRVSGTSMGPTGVWIVKSREIWLCGHRYSPCPDLVLDDDRGL